MADRDLDVAVIGAGVVGLAIARTLQGRGVRVAVFERSGIGAGASGVQPGGVRQQWGTAVACRLARESVAFYGDAQRRLGAAVELRFDRCGYLFVAHSAAALERLAANVAVQNAEGVPSPIRERLVEPLVISAERRFAAKQLANGRVLASDLGARGDESGRERWRANVRAGIEELLPRLAFVSFPVLVHGEYDVTPDRQPVL